MNEEERVQRKAMQYSEAQTARQAMQGRLVEIGLELRQGPKLVIRQALEHERHLICGALQGRRTPDVPAGQARRGQEKHDRV